MSRNADPLAALFDAAKAAQANAHAPYSGYRVGAALRTAEGAIFSGGNVENASYPEGWCAETSAIAAMEKIPVRHAGKHIATSRQRSERGCPHEHVCQRH